MSLPNGVPKPVVKWVGGKTQLLENISENAPIEYGKYIEPFFGGGAVFFSLYKQGRVKKAVISDNNPELINLYSVIRDEPKKLIRELKKLEGANTSEEYYAFRHEFNALAKKEGSRVRRAALFIYLNKTCYNGLWRVNKKGEFNVPFGRYKKPAILDEENILAVSKAFQKAKVTLSDFEDTVQVAKEGDFVYFDPPYAPITETAKFTSYTKDGFENGEQERLATVFRELASDGVYVLESNSDAPVVSELYKGFDKVVVQAKRYVNCKGHKRGDVNELLIKSY